MLVILSIALLMVVIFSLILSSSAGGLWPSNSCLMHLLYSLSSALRISVFSAESNLMLVPPKMESGLRAARAARCPWLQKINVTLAVKRHYACLDTLRLLAVLEYLSKAALDSVDCISL